MNRQNIIGARIKQARENVGLSQGELGKLFGCSDVNISRIERGITGISISDLEKMAVILGKPLDWFLADEVRPAPRPPEAALSEIELSLKSFIPVYGEVSAGAGVEPIDYVASSRLSPPPDSYRAYRVKGLCLEPEVRNGDTLIVDTALQPRDGDLVIVLIDGQASVKEYHEKEPGGHGFVQDGRTEYKWLQNNHGKYQPEDVRLHGVVVELNRKRR